MSIQLLILSLFLSLSLSEDAPSATSPSLKCTRPKSSICTLHNLVYVDFRLPLLPELDSKRTVQIRSGNMPRFSKELAQKFGNAITVQLGHLQIQSIWLGSNVRHFSAEGNLIQTLMVEDMSAGSKENTEKNETTIQFQMETLNLENNKLKNIRELKNFDLLVELQLDGNELEFIEMEIFSNMKKLKKLSLTRNRISKVSAGKSIELPVLGWLSFGQNNLSSIRMRNLQMPQLTELYLSHNQLVSLDIDGFDQFVSLEKLTIAANPWSCYWLDKALKLMDRKYVTLADSDADCKLMLMEGICCAMTEISNDYPSFADLAERIIAFENFQHRKFSELENRLDETNQIWSDEWKIIDETVAEKELKMKKLTDPADDSRVTEKDISELTSMINDLGENINNLQALGEVNGKFAQDFTKLLYLTWEQKNKLISHAKNVTNLKDQMDKYKLSFDANF